MWVRCGGVAGDGGCMRRTLRGIEGRPIYLLRAFDMEADRG